MAVTKDFSGILQADLSNTPMKYGDIGSKKT
jgi:hypothetical protein